MAVTDLYNLDVQVRINRIRQDGGYTGEQLTISQEMQIQADSFIEIASILGKFQETAEKIKGERDLQKVPKK